MAKKNTGCLILVLITLPMLLIAVAGWYSFKSYKTLQKKIAAEINQLEPFDKNQASEEAAEELKLSIPVQQPSMTEKEIRKAVKKELKQIAKKKIPSSILSLKTKAIIKKYRVAKKGDHVSFRLNTTGKRISGIYKGILSDRKGKMLKVDYNKYRIYDIGIESLYHFDNVISQKRIAEDIVEIKKEFKGKRGRVIQENRKEILEKYYTSAGYRRQGDDWKSNFKFYTELLEEKKNKHKREQKRQLQGIYENNQLFGIIPVTIEEEKTPNGSQ